MFLHAIRVRRRPDGPRQNEKCASHAPAFACASSLILVAGSELAQLMLNLLATNFAAFPVLKQIILGD